MLAAAVGVASEVFLYELRAEGGTMGLGNYNPGDAWEGNALLAEDWAGTVVIGWSVEYGGGPASFPSILLADGAVIEGFK